MIRRVLVGLGFAGLVAFGGLGWCQSTWLEVRTDTVVSARIAPEFDGYRVVFASDFHFGIGSPPGYLAAVVRAIGDARPDVVVLGGDFLSPDLTAAREGFAALRALEAPDGVYAVLGNHDQGGGRDLVVTELARAGVVWLDNRAVTLTRGSASWRLVGLDDVSAGTPDFGVLNGGDPAVPFTIVLAHHPDTFEITARGASYDLMLSGHTHGGQITVLGLFAPYVPSSYGQKYRTGLVTEGNRQIVISNGVGTTGLPIRWFARPQVNVVVLKAGR